MRSGWILSWIGVFLGVFSSSAFCADLELVFDQLKESGVNYETTGAICEQVARLKLQERFPSTEYDIQNGVVYTDGTRILGELDVVVFRNSDHKAILVGEVKCWENLKKARIHAQAQRTRFQDYLRVSGRIRFYLNEHKEITFQTKQFTGSPPFILISQNGGEKAGFDLALDFNLDELMRLRTELIACQNAGICKSPAGT